MRSKILIGAIGLFLVAVVGITGLAYAQTTSSTTGTGSSTGTGTTVTPGVPNTGAGGEMPMNVVALVASVLMMSGGAFYLFRDRRVSRVAR
jgi:hypothetical protein